MKKIVSILFLLIFWVWTDGFGWPIPDTGQTKCYDDTQEIPCPDPGEPYYGQDGNYTINPMSFTKLDASGNELSDEATEWAMVRDNVTGLIWEVKHNKDDVKDYSNPNDADNTYTWYDPNSDTNGGDAGTPGDGTDTYDFINDLNAQNFGGYSDWRIPTREELRTILNYNIPEPGPVINIGYFINIFLFGYWSSETDSYYAGNAWYIEFEYGFDGSSSKTYEQYVLGVRGKTNQSSDHLVINNNNTITDKKTGLIWEVKSDDGGTRDRNNIYTWQEALEYCKDLTLIGYTDWRLPTIKELSSLVVLTKFDPSINTNYFSNTLSSDYWTSTSRTDNTNNAWSVNFKYGGDDLGNNKSYSLYVRAVRGGQPMIGGHLYITLPQQGSFWDIGNTMGIEWDAVDISGDVKISLSRQGGKEGTFETIAASTPNDGYFEWVITGPESYNCMLGIEPLANPDLGTMQGMFTIENPPTMISVLSNIEVASFTITGPATYTGLGKSWSQSGAPIGEYTITYDPVDCRQTPVSQNLVLTEGNTIHFTGNYTDISDPEPPINLDPTVSPHEWTNINAVVVAWNASADCGDGIAGYSYVWDTSDSTEPDSIVDTTETSIYSPSLEDGNDHYFHIKSVDNASNISETVHLGPFYIDATPPDPPVNPVSSSHTINVCSDDNTIELSWTAATDNLSGVDGYDVGWNTSSDTPPASISRTPETFITSPAFMEGNYYVHLRAVDTAGNPGEYIHTGPFCIQTGNALPPPTGLMASSDGSHRITLKWDATLTGEGLTYNIYRSDDKDGYYIKINPAPVNNIIYENGQWRQQYVDTDLLNGFEYWYKVTAVDSDQSETVPSNIVSAIPKPLEGGDFRIEVLAKSRMVSPGDAVTFDISVVSEDKFHDAVRLWSSCPNLPSMVVKKFSPEIIIPTGNTELSFVIPYPFGGTYGDYDIEITGTSESITHQTDVILQIVNPGVGDCLISAVPDADEIRLGERVNIQGQLIPWQTSGTNIWIDIISPGETDWNRHAAAIQDDSAFRFNYEPAIIGKYQVRAVWVGNLTGECQSDIETFTVVKGNSTIRCSTSTQTIEPNKSVDIQVELRPALEGVPFRLEIQDPVGDIKVIDSLSTQSGGKRVFSYFLNQEGVWEIKACWMGNEDYIGAMSLPLKLYPGIEIGEAMIIAGGGIPNNGFWDATEYLCNRFYRILKNRRFEHDQITYFSPYNYDYDIDDDGAPDILIDVHDPDPGDIRTAIENLYPANAVPKVDPDKPLTIYIAGHGYYSGIFQLDYGIFLSAADLDTWLDDLQNATGCQVAIMIEACHSGIFIDALAPEPGQDRILISSADEGLSFSDNDGYISFSQYLLNYIEQGNSLRDVFLKTIDDIVFHSILQHQTPNLDDGQQGLLASDFYIGGTFEISDVRPEIVDATLSQSVDAGHLALFVRVFDLEGINDVWLTILPPHYQMFQGIDDDETPVVHPEKIYLSDADDNNRYEADYNFKYNGDYIITFFVKDSGGNIVSHEIRLTTANGIMFGDVNTDKILDVGDAIMALRIVAGTTSDVPVNLAVETGEDTRIGLREALYILRNKSMEN